VIYTKATKWKPQDVLTLKIDLKLKSMKLEVNGTLVGEICGIPEDKEYCITAAMYNNDSISFIV